MSTRKSDHDLPPSEPPATPPSADLGFDLPEPPKVSRRRVALVLIGLAICVGVAFVAGYLPKHEADAQLEERTPKSGAHSARVATLEPKLLRKDSEIELPGSVQPLAEATLYPQANGYIKRFLVDIGAHVKEGELLAEIETPALDQELDQAKAELVQAEATHKQTEAARDFSNTSLNRYAVLKPSGVASQQELDQRRSEALVSESNVAAAQAAIAVQKANIRRLIKLLEFSRVTAPFEGIITMRSIDRGTLVTSGNSTPMFRLVATDPVRVFVQVPQDVAPTVSVGTKAEVRVREFPGRIFEGEVKHTAGALDMATRTMTTEVRVPNPNNELLTGMYSNVSFKLKSPHPVYEVPGTALYNDSQGLRLATVDAQNRIRFVKVTIERDLGSTLQIASGLSGDERIVRLANASLMEGTLVEVDGE
ncbi:MAG: efflux RND transporter periplasmic adaptor subunit [Myxococcales bacterium]